VTVEKIIDPVDAGVSSTETPLYAAMRKAIIASASGRGRDADAGAVRNRFRVSAQASGSPAYGLTPMILDTATGGDHA
jgi:hypothetical protein